MPRAFRQVAALECVLRFEAQRILVLADSLQRRERIGGGDIHHTLAGLLQVVPDALGIRSCLIEPGERFVLLHCGWGSAVLGEQRIGGVPSRRRRRGVAGNGRSAVLGEECVGCVGHYSTFPPACLKASNAAWFGNVCGPLPTTFAVTGPLLVLPTGTLLGVKSMSYAVFIESMFLLCLMAAFWWSTPGIAARSFNTFGAMDAPVACPISHPCTRSAAEPAPERLFTAAILTRLTPSAVLMLSTPVVGAEA